MNFKKLAVIFAIGFTALSPNIIKNTSVDTPTSIVSALDENCEFIPTSRVNLIKASREENITFSIQDQALAKAMMTILNKSTNSFNSKDLIDHVDYKVQQEENGTTTDENGNEIPAYKDFANKTYLDLSYKKITDITELCQFKWPKTLVGIDLTGNNITNENMEKLAQFTTFTGTEELKLTEALTLQVYADASNIDIINLNLNDISLTTLDNSFLNNNKFLFGMQKLSNDVHNKEHPTEYYFRTSELGYYDIVAKVNNTTFNIVADTPTKLSSHGLGRYEITFEIKDKFNFKPTVQNIDTSLYNIYIIDTFWVERLSLFSINKSNIVVEGLTEGYEIYPYNATTKNTGTQYVNIRFVTNTKEWTTNLTYEVKDTIAPRIELNELSTIYLRKDSKYIEYRAKGYDGYEDISERITISGDVDTSKTGTYIITYNLTDYSDNQAIPVTRKVIVQEYALSVSLSAGNQDLVVDKDIIITADLPHDADLNKYREYQYDWYYNGVKFMSNKGDILTGKGNVSFKELSPKNVEIYCKLTVTLTDGTTEEYISEPLKLEIEKSSSSSAPTIIISVIIALVLIIGLYIGIVIYKKKSATNTKGKKKPADKKKSKKTKKKKGSTTKGPHSNYDTIKVIKNYGTSDDNDEPPSTMQY